MNIRNNLIKKYFIKTFNDEFDLYNSSMLYRIECINNNIPDDVNISKYFNVYELRDLIGLIKLSAQTKDYKLWFNKAFKNSYYECFEDKNKKIDLSFISPYWGVISGILIPTIILISEYCGYIFIIMFLVFILFEFLFYIIKYF